VRALLDSLLQTTPERDASWTAVLEAAIQFLDSLARRVSKLDNYAHERLVQDIEDMKRCLEQSAEPVSFDVWEWLAALPDSAPILGRGPREGCLHVASVSSGGHSGRRQTFIVGLDDARFPGPGLQDPLLLDREREKLSAELTTSASRLEARQRAFGRLLARLRGQVTLSYSCRDLLHDRDLFPSPVVLTAYRILSGNHEGEQSDLLAWPSFQTPVSFAPAQPQRCLDESEWWLLGLCGREPSQEASKLVAQRFPHLGRGWEASRQRASADFTIYDGRVEQAGGDLDPTAANGPVLSSRKLETAGRCPLAYFFQQGLEIEPPEELALDPTRWLDSQANGKLLHEVFEQFMREQLQRDRLPAYRDDQPRLRSILDQYVAVYRDLYPPPSDSVFQGQYRQLQRTVDVFLKEEEAFCLRRNCRPVFLEAAIGMATAGLGSPLDTAEPVVISLPEDKRLRVRGRVDRVDRIGTGAVQTFAIWDYKSGSAFKYTQADPFRQGRVIQPFLYLSLVGHRLREAVSPEAHVGLFGFFFPGVRERGLRMDWASERLAAGSEVLERLCQIIREGAFLATDNAKEDCGYCNYLSICGNVEAVAAASRRKLDNPSNTLLQPFLELRPHGKVQDAVTDQ
jgi:RecB family exonuclease